MSDTCLCVCMCVFEYLKRQACVWGRGAVSLHLIRTDKMVPCSYDDATSNRKSDPRATCTRGASFL